MKASARRAVLAGLVSATMVTSLSVGATSASAIGRVSCTSDEFLKITVHFGDNDIEGSDWCYANKGWTGLPQNLWITKIWTGKNVVQWRGDGRWQPQTPIGKNRPYTWPNHWGGVRIDAIKIF
ncbi:MULTISPECIES: hypothetical protein [unclassified Streptomyces]|uniref:hypothetical protein n=1 Tax=unclassified Streptomyces TaxID=2593676 RepID=UPI000F7210D3|nr:MULTISPECIES: hypothetical protein [unclassified Streptomyces]AZM61680.1 hypothetical protein DLM49_20900 [Streptomyces sp. WAC 01438]RSN02133.1 hypothetical protein DMA10_00055 [Streptomyces sp. WAC 01420]